MGKNLDELIDEVKKDPKVLDIPGFLDLMSEKEDKFLKELDNMVIIEKVVKKAKGGSLKKEQEFRNGGKVSLGDFKGNF